MVVLGIEASCDETSVAIVDQDRQILTHQIYSQIDQHKAYGGVVPEIAARAHLERLPLMARSVLETSGLGWDQIDGIAATSGPGLIGGLIVGSAYAKGLALAQNKPFLAVNHLEGHALTARLTDKIAFPFLLLLISGGHCQLLLVKGVGNYQRLGTTIDDAAGEAFDKTAKLLGLGFPGGPNLEICATRGDANRFALPRPMKGKPNLNFSFSGLKTAVRRQWELLDQPNDQDKADLCASFQLAVGESLADRCKRGIALMRDQGYQDLPLVVAGGVACNQAIAERLNALCDQQKCRLVMVDPKLCTDNGAMIAWAGLERLRLGQSDGLDFAPTPRWPLDPQAPKELYAGGAKA